MKRILFVIALLTTGCAKESSVAPGNAPTFVRYFNGGNNDVAETVVETSDKGLLILATTAISTSLTSTSYKIKLIKTDAFGNPLWQKFYPDFTTTSGSYQAAGMSVLPNGTIAIAGTSIRNDSSFLMLLTTDADGENPKEALVPAFPINDVNVKPLATNGLGVTSDAAGDFLVLGSIQDTSQHNNMVVARISSDLGTVLWSGVCGAGTVALVNKLFLDASQENLYWGGTVIRTNSNAAVRLIEVVADSQNEGALESDPVIGNPLFTETANDICAYRFGTSFAFAGESNEKKGSSTPGTTTDILYKLVGQDGTLISSVTYPITGVGPNHDGANQNETGNSIWSTQDGGLLLLGTVNSQGSFGNGGKDYYLIKIDYFGNVQWTKLYGSQFDDVGAQVIQASDGGYIVLGTTTLANLKTIMLMKTTINGTIQ